MAIIIIFILVFVSIGLALLFNSIRGRIKVNVARDWPVAKGLVLESEVVEERLRNATGQATISFVPQISYEYVVNGEKLTGSRVTFGSITFDYQTALEICESFPVEKTTNVYYNPKDPSDSVLAPKSKSGLRSIVPGVFFILVGIVVGVISVIYR